MDSYRQRSNIRKARQRDPIVSVFMHNNPNRCYSITVPSNKSWTEFINKIRKQFQLASTANISLYQSSIDRQQDEDEEIDINELHQYDIEDTDMSKIRHKYVICVKVNDDEQDQDSNDNESNHNNLDYQSKQKRQKKRRKKKKKHQQRSSDDSESSGSKSENEGSENKEDENDQMVDINERDFGIDLDLFDRICTSKKARSSNKKPIYHFHPTSVIQSLPFHLKQTWLNLKQQPMTVKHIDDKYTMMQDPDKQYTLRTRRLIWPRNLQNRTDEFEYRLTDISNKWIWAILIIHGGKFAGAVYHGNNMILHKTLRRYVVRKKQGKRQVNHLSTSGVRSGSAGGYKRAWNEKKLLEEIREILSLWMEELNEKCDKIFIHAPGVYNQITLYGNNEEQTHLYPQQNGQLNEDLSKERLIEIKNKNKNKYTNLYRLYKKDERIMQIPITTHGVTLQEVERVHYWLSTCWLSKNEDNSTESEQD